MTRNVEGKSQNVETPMDFQDSRVNKVKNLDFVALLVFILAVLLTVGVLSL